MSRCDRLDAVQSALRYQGGSPMPDFIDRWVRAYHADLQSVYAPQGPRALRFVFGGDA